MGVIVLVGMMGSGKSTVGRAVASILGRPFRDTDQLLEHRLGRRVSEWFKIYGEEAFREHETLVLKGLEPDDSVLATGGGIVLREENWQEMRRLGTTVFMDVDPEVLKDRLSKTKRIRPLLTEENWQDKFDRTYEMRRPLYLKADMCVRVADQELEDVAQEIAKAWTSP